MKMREPSSADMRRTALTEKRDREPGIMGNWCFGVGLASLMGRLASLAPFTVSWPHRGGRRNVVPFL